jgi:hypothetical protein
MIFWLLVVCMGAYMLHRTISFEQAAEKEEEERQKRIRELYKKTGLWEDDDD